MRKINHFLLKSQYCYLQSKTFLTDTVPFSLKLNGSKPVNGKGAPPLKEDSQTSAADSLPYLPQYAQLLSQRSAEPAHG